jgi:hypothetical protein
MHTSGVMKMLEKQDMPEQEWSSLIVRLKSIQSMTGLSCHRLLHLLRHQEDGVVLLQTTVEEEMPLQVTLED